MKKYFLYILLNSITLHLFGKVVDTDLRERVYVQTDKNLYLAGESVLMKFLTTDHEQIPLVFSKVAYAELVADSLALLQIKVEMTNGTGAGLMQLPADLNTGYYRLIAYTQFMRNEGADVFFEKNIAVLNTFQSGYYPTEVDEFFLHDAQLSFEENDSSSLSLYHGTTYARRERGELLITGLPENIYTLSVSIVGKEIIPVTESNVSLFNKTKNKKSTEFTDDFAPEYEGHIITGAIINNQTERVEINDSLLSPNDPLLLPALSFPGEGIRFFAGQKSETGDVRFFTLGSSGTKEIAVSVYLADEKYRIEVKSPYISQFVYRQMPTLHIDSVYYGQLLARSVALQVFHYFSDDPSENTNISEAYLKMKPTFSYLLEDYTQFRTMQEVFVEIIAGVRFNRQGIKRGIQVFTKSGSDYIYGTTPLVFLDGVPVLEHDAIFNYDPLSVEKINVYYGPYTLGGYMFDGILELITYRGLYQNLNLNRATQVLSYEGPQSSFIFNSPDYSDENNRGSRMPDRRHTLLWNPDVKTDGKNPIRVHFDTSDLIGEFQTVVEGITKDGKIIFVTSCFKVE